ncbi:hypothetical protein [Bacillus suaedae]|uniref:Uncharacterized protein n=1 Tax=Halalkalibacter suaedae TaxID=2822140 RepID=A0A940WPT4_9BACI|nr:hypothetical protein [Bacillus suaedae]MBP3950116.1 hypothetical protein [Bacillus suaedae]
MGVYYFIILFIGVFFVVGAGMQAFKSLSMTKKSSVFLAIGVSLIGLSIFLFLPESSDIIAELLGIG